MSDAEPQMRGELESHSNNRPRFRKESGPMVIGKTLGKVKWFHATKGFGFIVGPHQEDVFAHFSVIAGDGYKALRDGSVVMYEAVRTPEGWRATWVEHIKDENDTHDDQNPKHDTKHDTKQDTKPMPRLAQPRTMRQGNVLRGANRIEEAKPDPFEKFSQGRRGQ